MGFQQVLVGTGRALCLVQGQAQDMKGTLSRAGILAGLHDASSAASRRSLNSQAKLRRIGSAERQRRGALPCGGADVKRRERAWLGVIFARPR